MLSRLAPYLTSLFFIAYLVLLMPACAYAKTTSSQPQKKMYYGVTVTNIKALDDIYLSIKHFHCKPIVRVVFDPDTTPEYYQPALVRLHKIAFIMGGLLDSFSFKSMTFMAFRKRTKAFMVKLKHDVDIWEVGNEINGSWLGKPTGVVKKLNYAFYTARKLHVKTAITFYYNQACYKYQSNEMFYWIKHFLPKKIKRYVNYVFVSYYPQDCHNDQPDWLHVFKRLHRIFPQAKLGFGEVGTHEKHLKTKYLDRFYNLNLPVKNFIGGYFWWYFNADMVPFTKKYWMQLNEIMIAQTSRCETAK